MFGCIILLFLGGKFAKMVFFLNNWWFAAAYLSLYLLSPGINYLVETSSKLYVILLLLFFVYIDNGTPWNHNFDFGGFYSMIMIYIGARCVNLYVPETKQKKWAILIFLTAIILRICLVYACYRFDKLDKLFAVNSIGNPLTFLIASSAFLSMSNLHFSSKIINWLAASSFAVYLLSESSFGVNLFTSCFKSDSFDIFRYIGCAVAIYIFIACIDQIRKPITEFLFKYISNFNGYEKRI